MDQITRMDTHRSGKLREWSCSRKSTQHKAIMNEEQAENAMDYMGTTSVNDVGTSKNISSKSEEKCNNIKFHDLCLLLERVEKAQGSEHKLKLVFNKEMKKEMNGESLYPLLRLLLPTIDSERSKYGLKQAMVAKTYVSALHLDKSSEAATRLINWKDPSKASSMEASKMVIGDFGTILEDVLKSRVRSDRSEATLRDVNQLLDSLAQAVSPPEKTAIIRDRILNQFTAMEQKWLARIIFSDLKIGLKHETVLNHFYPTALKRFNECVSLRLVCEEEGITTELSGVQLFVCYSPMLAKGFSQSSVGQVTAVELAMDQQPFIMDIKLDGERLSVHIGDDGTAVMMFTRRRNDYSENYAPLGELVRESVQIGTGKGTRCILDGEVCAWDRASQCYLPFGNNANVRNKERDCWLSAKAAGGAGSSSQQLSSTQQGASQGAGSSSSRADSSRNGVNGTNSSAAGSGSVSQSCAALQDYESVLTAPKGWDKDLPTWTMFIAFDILYLEGPASERIIQQSLQECGIYGRYVPPGEITNLPLIVRRAILSKVLSPIPNRVDIVPSRIVTAQDTNMRKEQIEAYFNEVTLSGEEGLVIKNLNSCYELGEKSRATALWVKMKPEYGDQTDDLDLLVLGAYYGEGKGLRGKGISTFVCGVKDDRNPDKYHTLCKVGTGYSFDELLAFRKLIADISVPWNPRSPPPHLSSWKMAKKDLPNVFIPPEKSIVVTLKCAEIVPSANFSCGLCCRFPRIQAIRHDKAYTDIMSLKDVYDLKQQLRNTTHEVAARETDARGASGKRGKKATQAGEVGTGTRMRGYAVDDAFRVSSKAVEQQGQIFEGHTYCVLESEFVHHSSGSGSGGGAGVVRKFTRDDLIHAIRSQGGIVVASATMPECKVIAGSKRTMQINNLIERGEKDVIDFAYIVDCVNAGALLPLKRTYLLGMAAETRAKFRGTADIFGDSYMDEVLPDELSKIFATFDRTVASLDKKHASFATSTGKVSAYAPVKSRRITGKDGLDRERMQEERVKERERQEELAAVQDWRQMQSMGWRELAARYLCETEEREPLYNQWNSLWQDGVVLYLDVSDDLGACTEDAATTTISTSKPATAGPRSSSAQPHSALSSPIKPPSKATSGPPSGALSPGVRITTAAGSALPALQHTQAEAHEVLMTSVRRHAELHGAKVSGNLHNKVTHVVMRPEELSRAGKIKERMRLLRTLEVHNFEKRLVTPQWVEFCVQVGHIVEPTLPEHMITL